MWLGKFKEHGNIIEEGKLVGELDPKHKLYYKSWIVHTKGQDAHILWRAVIFSP